MNGEELKQYIKRSGMSVAAVAEELGTSPQNLNAKFNRKSIKIDFFQKIKEIIDKCAPPLPAEMEEAVFGSNSSNVSQSSSDAALAAENKLLREQNEFLQSQVKTLLAIVGQK